MLGRTTRRLPAPPTATIHSENSFEIPSASLFPISRLGFQRLVVCSVNDLLAKKLYTASCTLSESQIGLSLWNCKLLLLSTTTTTANENILNSGSNHNMLYWRLLFAHLLLAIALPVRDATALMCGDDSYSMPRELYHSKALEACEKLFNPPRARDPGAATEYQAHVWYKKSLRADRYMPYTFILDGKIEEMDMEKCEYAFTSSEALDSNRMAGKVCDADGDAGDGELVRGWEFQRDGRTYSVIKGVDYAMVREDNSNPNDDEKARTFWVPHFEIAI